MSGLRSVPMQSAGGWRHTNVWNRLIYPGEVLKPAREVVYAANWRRWLWPNEWDGSIFDRPHLMLQRPITGTTQGGSL